MKQTFTLDTSPTSTALCRFREERKNKTEFEEITTCTIMESTSIPPVHNVQGMEYMSVCVCKIKEAFVNAKRSKE